MVNVEVCDHCRGRGKGCFRLVDRGWQCAWADEQAALALQQSAERDEALQTPVQTVPERCCPHAEGDHSYIQGCAVCECPETPEDIRVASDQRRLLMRGHDPGDPTCKWHDPKGIYTAMLHRCELCQYEPWAPEGYSEDPAPQPRSEWDELRQSSAELADELLRLAEPVLLATLKGVNAGLAWATRAVQERANRTR